MQSNKANQPWLASLAAAETIECIDPIEASNFFAHTIGSRQIPH
jgi:hypothetical protein